MTRQHVLPVLVATYSQQCKPIPSQCGKLSFIWKIAGVLRVQSVLFSVPQVYGITTFLEFLETEKCEGIVQRSGKRHSQGKVKESV